MAQRAKVESRRPDVSARARASWGAAWLDVRARIRHNAREATSRGCGARIAAANPRGGAGVMGCAVFARGHSRCARRRSFATPRRGRERARHGVRIGIQSAGARACGMGCEVQPAGTVRPNARGREGVMGCEPRVPVRVPSARAHPPATSWGASCSTRHPTAPDGTARASPSRATEPDRKRRPMCSRARCPRQGRAAVAPRASPRAAPEAAPRGARGRSNARRGSGSMCSPAGSVEGAASARGWPPARPARSREPTAAARGGAPWCPSCSPSTSRR